MRDRKGIMGLALASVLVLSNVSPVLAAPETSATPSASADVTPTATPLDTEVNVNGKYHATLGFETDSYRNVYRYGYFDDKDRAKKEWKQISSGTIGEDDYQSYQGTFKNAIIKGNGTYSVRLSNANYRYANTFKLLQVSTDIPNTGAITFSNMKVIVNGEEKLSFKKVSTSSNRDYVVLYAINDKKEALADLGDDKRIVPSSYQSNSVVIKFKVSGFSYKKGETAPTPTPVATPTIEPTQEPATEASAQPDVSAGAEAITGTEAPKVNEVTTERKVGMGFVVVIAIGGIVASLVVVNKRKR